MVCIQCIMPEQAEVTAVEAHFVDEAFAEEVGFIFGEMHVVFSA